VLGALYAPSLVRFAGLSDSLYQDTLIIGISVLAGFVVQLLGWVLLAVIAFSSQRYGPYIIWGLYRRLPTWPIRRLYATIYLGLIAIASLLPLAAVGYKHFTVIPGHTYLMDNIV
jgi:hypothetical protein